VREIRNWGYCTRSGRISINWQLIALPERLREYVLLHELTHLSEFNHSRQFYRRLSSVCPDYRRRERELDEVETISPVSSSSDADASRHGLPFF
jgi:predicted metal-dependent hydrolase